MYTIVTSRFNNDTRDANYAYRRRQKYDCLYCSPVELSPKISYNTPVFVIEMNNSTNKVEGIGLIKNKPETNKYYKVYEDANTNRYTYIGKYYINRETIDYYNSRLLAALEVILFTGYTHSKRGLGLTMIPQKATMRDVCEGINVKNDVKDLFLCHFMEKLRLLDEPLIEQESTGEKNDCNNTK